MSRKLSRPLGALALRASTFDGFVATSNSLQHRRLLYIAIIASLVILATVAIAFGYMAAAYPDQDWTALEVHNYSHVALALMVNVICALLAARLKGPMASRLRAAIVYALIVHLVLIIVLFGFRLYYSRTVIILGLFASLSLIALVTLVAEIYRPQRIGIMSQGLSLEVAPWLDHHVIPIDLSRHAPTDFDVVLVNWIEPLDQRSMAFITHAALSGGSVRHIPEYIEHRSGRVLPEHFKPSHATSDWLNPYTRTVKRMVDLSIVLLTLPVVLPIVGIAALLIRRQMGTPVFFVQERIGLGGRLFKIYKLRTMSQASAGKPEIATSTNDARISPLGNFLRRHRIDELPQFYNVLRGDMSLVGPRPEQPGLTRRYQETMSAFRYRNMLPPGITGWSQVKAGYAADEVETLEKLMHDLYYVKHANFLLDVWIMAKTVATVVRGRGAR